MRRYLILKNRFEILQYILKPKKLLITWRIQVRFEEGLHYLYLQNSLPHLTTKGTTNQVEDGIRRSSVNFFLFFFSFGRREHL